MKIIDFTYYRIASFLCGKIKNWKYASIALITLIEISLLSYPLITIYSFNDMTYIVSKLSIYISILFIITYMVNIYHYDKVDKYDKIKNQYVLLKVWVKRLHGIITIVLVFLSFFYAPIALVLAGAKLQ